MVMKKGISTVISELKNYDFWPDFIGHKLPKKLEQLESVDEARECWCEWIYTLLPEENKIKVEHGDHTGFIDIDSQNAMIYWDSSPLD